MHRLRIAGLGHSLPLEVDADTTTVGALKEIIETNTGLPPCYQRLLARGTKLDSAESESLSLKDAGVKDRTKIMLLHSAVYAQEKQGFEALAAIASEVDDLANKASTMDPKLMAELVTRLCCRLDEVDTAGSANLRARRKALLHRAEKLEQKDDDITNADESKTNNENEGQDVEE